MVIVDTSVWVEHLRKGSCHLKELLLNEKVACHPFIIGELACGSLKNRDEIFSLLQTLPASPAVPLSELFYFIDKNNLASQGIGFVDVQLPASAQLSNLPLWTLDRRRKLVASKLNLSYTFSS